jgi:hypothetical protein
MSGWAAYRLLLEELLEEPSRQILFFISPMQVQTDNPSNSLDPGL